MLLDYHSFYGDVTPPPAPGAVWVPIQAPRVKPRQRREPEKVVVKGRLDVTLPAIEARGRVHTVPVPQLHARSDARLQPLQQQAQASASIGVEVRAGLPSVHAAGVSGVSQRASARLTLDAVTTTGSAQLRSSSSSDVSLQAAEAAAEGTARLTASMSGLVPELATRVVLTSTYRLSPPPPIVHDEWTDDMLIAAARYLLEEEDDD